MRWPSPPERRGGVAVEGEIAEADGVEEFEALDDLAAEAVGDEGFALGEVEFAGGFESAAQGQRGEVGDRHRADFDGERLGRRRVPWQAGQAEAVMNFSMYSRASSDLRSRVQLRR